jgi:hypothetical protein
MNPGEGKPPSRPGPPKWPFTRIFLSSTNTFSSPKHFFTGIVLHQGSFTIIGEGKHQICQDHKNIVSPEVFMINPPFTRILVDQDLSSPKFFFTEIPSRNMSSSRSGSP